MLPESVLSSLLMRAALLSICIQAAPAPAQAQVFHPLFDGKTLKGWHIQGEGSWRVDSGVIIGTHPITGKAFGHLVSDSSYVDFTLRYSWKLVRGNSGLYYHSQEGGTAGMIGPQVEMDGAFPGGIYTTNTDPWGWIVQPTTAQVKTWYKPDDWNLVTVTSKGPLATVTYNGIKTVETSDARLPASGHLGFQVHENLDCEVWVKDIQLALPATTGIAADRAWEFTPGGRKPSFRRRDLRGRFRAPRAPVPLIP